MSVFSCSLLFIKGTSDKINFNSAKCFKSHGVVCDGTKITHEFIKESEFINLT